VWPEAATAPSLLQEKRADRNQQLAREIQYKVLYTRAVPGAVCSRRHNAPLATVPLSGCGDTNPPGHTAPPLKQSRWRSPLRAEQAVDDNKPGHNMNTIKPERTPGWLNLPSLGLPLRMLFTGYLLVTGVGLLMAGVQILLTHGMADGKWGISVNDIVYSYYGNRGSSRIESKLEGSMKDKASVDVRASIVKWVQAGAPEEQWESSMKTKFQQNCVQCHGNIPGLPNFSTYQGVLSVSQIDRGASIDSLARVSHIHLFGISFIFLFVGFIFSFAIGVPRAIKAAVIFIPFAFLIVDVLSWWVTKWYPNFAIVTIVGGFGYTLAAAFMLLTSLYQMWVMPMMGRRPDIDAWHDD
jgi:hypothetical protein